MNPRTPTLYGLIKIHKDSAPIRPVVSYVGCPAYKLAKHLNTILKDTTSFKSKNGVKNSLDLVQKLENFEMNNGYKLASLDVQNMFGNISTKECITLVADLLERKNTNPVLSSEIMDTLRLVLKQNHFTFNNKIYKQTAGLIMGSPLSPLLAEIYMDHLEDRILNSKQAKVCVKFWYRYVDDILVCFDGTSRQRDNFVEFINSMNE